MENIHDNNKNGRDISKIAVSAVSRIIIVSKPYDAEYHPHSTEHNFRR